MDKYLWTIACFLAFIFTPYSLAKNLECYGITLTQKVKLTPYKQDPKFLEGYLGQFSFGADTYDLINGNMTLVILDTKSDFRAASTAGWKVIGKTRMNDLRLYPPNDEVQINCYDYL